MALHQALLLITLFSLCTPSIQSQLTFLSLAKDSLVGPAMSRWDLAAPDDVLFCNFSGILCDDGDQIIGIDLSSWSLSGYFPPNVCSSIPTLRILRLGHNRLNGGFPDGLLNCSLLEDLNLTFTGLSGDIPDLSPLNSLRSLDLSNNLFSGEFPISIANLTDLESVNFNENPGFENWRLPESITGLTKLQVLILSTSSLRGEIPDWIGNMTSLVDLELSGNFLVGSIPPAIGRLGNLRMLELYYNQLTGAVPRELGNLTRLIDIDLSVNQLTGGIPETLCGVTGLLVLQLYSNSLTGGIPPVLGNSTSLTMLSIYRNFLTGNVPANLGQFSELVVLELSENRLSGELPSESCAGGKLLYFLVLDNQFSGELPASLARCHSLLRFRVSGNQLHGSIPEGLLGLPRASIIDLGFNCLEGSISKSIGNAKNLSAFFMPSNRISGEIPREISWATSLVKIDLSNNLLSGPIPSQIGDLNKLNQLTLQGNRLESSIPESLSSLKSLNVLNLSNNLLTGEIPESLCELLPNSLDFSNNRLSGPVPLPLVKQGLIESVAGNRNLCIPIRFNLSGPILAPCPKPVFRKRLDYIWVVGASSVAAALGLLFFVRQWLNQERAAVVDRDRLSPSPSFSYEITSFHKLNFDHREIIDALIDKNIVGRGGSGIVYKIELSGGEFVVAVKRIFIRKSKEASMALNRELRSEVATLGGIRHKNIVKLYCCFSSFDSNLLVYEFMPNGNLWDALHKEWSYLDWPKRRRIAIGVAQGLAYLHHDLLFPIVHRDIKSSNILLDAGFEPKVADFGIAKVLQGRGGNDSTTAVIAGTYGYLAPEYAYSSKATTKCDVYSFGVVLMELITGKKPTEPEFGENKDIIHWVSSKMATREGAMEVLDKRILWGPFKEEMIGALRISVRCTCVNPGLRPSMNEVVQLLIESTGSPFKISAKAQSPN